jgi:hypothetical protein
MGGGDLGWVWGGGEEWGCRVVVVFLGGGGGCGDGCLAALLQGPLSRRKRRRMRVRRKKRGCILVARCRWGWGGMKDSRCGRGVGGRVAVGGGEGRDRDLLKISRYALERCVGKGGRGNEGRGGVWEGKNAVTAMCVCVCLCMCVCVCVHCRRELHLTELRLS